ncbi:MAG: hypothetical protein ABH951_01610 [Patescibacteria group bacterium]
MSILDKIKKTKKWKLVLIVFAVCLIFYWSFTLFSPLTSANQKTLVKELGEPTSYTIVFGEMIVDEEYKTARYETWSYERHGRSFSFLDGKFISDMDITFIDEADPFPISANKFKEGMTFEQIKKIIGAEPSTVITAPDQLIEDTKIYNFNEQIKVAVKSDEVVYIQSFPIKVK